MIKYRVNLFHTIFFCVSLKHVDCKRKDYGRNLVDRHCSNFGRTGSVIKSQKNSFIIQTYIYKI